LHRIQDALKRLRVIDPFAAALAGIWCALYVWRALVRHDSLASNAYDLSVFDYALWNLGHGNRAFVPFMGHSLFSHHFMPILILIAPVYALFQSPVFLLVLQLVAVAAAGVAFYGFARRIGVERVLAIALVAIFLFSRRTHSAAASFFYPEVFQPLLTFAMVAAWPRGGWRYWTSVVLLMTTKEDAAIYVAGFAALRFVLARRQPLVGVSRRALVTAGVATTWFACAMWVAIPGSRAREGLPADNPVLEARFTNAEGRFDAGVIAARLASAATAETVVNVFATTGFLPILGPLWIAPALPGLVANLAAEPDSFQARLMDHYWWPVLPWMILAAASGTAWLQGRSRRLAFVWVFVAGAATLADNPALRRIGTTRADLDARRVLEQLHGVTGRTILAQPNLVPHLSHTNRLWTVGARVPPPEPPELVLLTKVGNLWPLSDADVVALIAQYGSDPQYETVTSGPLYSFRRR
jgi:uncharacterized membrane protein